MSSKSQNIGTVFQDRATNQIASVRLVQLKLSNKMGVSSDDDSAADHGEQQGGEKKTNRGFGWKHEEYLSLAKAYSANSETGDVGPDQSAPVFWDKVFDSFKKLLPKTKRTAGALKKKWHHEVSKHMMTFSNAVRVYKRENRSGASPGDEIVHAKEDYEEKYGREPMLDVWRVVSAMHRYSDDPHTYSNYKAVVGKPKKEKGPPESRTKGRVRAKEEKLEGKEKKAARSPLVKQLSVSSKRSKQESDNFSKFMGVVSSVLKPENAEEAEQKIESLTRSLINYEKVWAMNPEAYPKAEETRRSLNLKIEALMGRMDRQVVTTPTSVGLPASVSMSLEDFTNNNSNNLTPVVNAKPKRATSSKHVVEDDEDSDDDDNSFEGETCDENSVGSPLRRSGPSAELELARQTQTQDSEEPDTSFLPTAEDFKNADEEEKVEECLKTPEIGQKLQLRSLQRSHKLIESWKV